ncbi:unnamed protein product [Musa acuminata subsp. burmannicoides]
MASRLSLLPNLSLTPTHGRRSGALPRPRPISAVCTTFASFGGGDPSAGNWARMVRRGSSMISRGCLAMGAGIADGKNKTQDARPIVVIDNYDSFTYNLCQYIGELGVDFEVYRNDEITVGEVKEKCPRGILISPGPGTPQDSGISLQTVLELGPSVPLFGVCMGLQCIGEAFGGKIVRSPSGVVHGKSSLVYYDEELDDTLFCGLPNPFTAGRYHSLVIDKDSFPNNVLDITAWTEDGQIMAARHKKYTHIQGVQFHPESIITTEGKIMVHNFIKLTGKLEAQNSKS